MIFYIWNHLLSICVYIIFSFTFTTHTWCIFIQTQSTFQSISLSPRCIWVRISSSLVFSVVICESFFISVYILFGRCIVYPSSIYGFWAPYCYLQIFSKWDAIIKWFYISTSFFVVLTVTQALSDNIRTFFSSLVYKNRPRCHW